MVHVSQSHLMGVNDASQKVNHSRLSSAFVTCNLGFSQVLILEPLGVLDIHVSRVPEGPNNCVKITEEWYRYCWDQLDPL